MVGTGSERNTWIVRALPVVSVAVILAAYQFCYALSFFPITEGWFSTYASLIRNGAVPYRDFSLLMPPLYPLQFAIGQAIFGESLLVARLFGVALGSAMGVVLWAIIRRLFAPWIAAFAACVAMVYYQSGNAFIGYDFTQVLTFYLLLAAYFMLAELDRSDTNVRARWWLSPAMWSGFFLAAATLTKQSNGGLATLVLTLAFALVCLRRAPLPVAMRQVGQLVVGGLALLLPVLLGLTIAGALPAFLQQTVIDAVLAKGGGGPIFFGWIAGFFGDPLYFAHLQEMAWQLALVLAWTGGPSLVAVGAWALLRRQNPTGRMAALAPRALAIALAVIGIAGSGGLVWVVTATRFGGSLLDLTWHDQAALIYNNVIAVAVHLYLAGVLIALVLLWLRPSLLASRLVIVFAFGVGLTVGNGTSAGLSEISAFLALAIAVAALTTLAAPALLPAVVPIGLSLMLCAFLVELKFERPYAWWSVEIGDVRLAECAPAEGLVAGLCIDPNKYRAMMELVTGIEAITTPEDALYVFPHEPIFNLLSRRTPYRNAVVTWFDFTSVAQGTELAAALRSDPPAAIVMSRLPEDVFAAHERLFNAGRPSVQREIVRAVDDLVAAGQITLRQSTEIDGLTLELYGRAR